MSPPSESPGASGARLHLQANSGRKPFPDRRAAPDRNPRWCLSPPNGWSFGESRQPGLTLAAHGATLPPRRGGRHHCGTRALGGAGGDRTGSGPRAHERGVRLPGRHPVDARGRYPQRDAVRAARAGSLHRAGQRRAVPADILGQHDQQLFRSGTGWHLLLLHPGLRYRDGRLQPGPDRRRRRAPAERDDRRVRHVRDRRRLGRRRSLRYGCGCRLGGRLERPARGRRRRLRGWARDRGPVGHDGVSQRPLRRLQRRHRRRRPHRDRGHPGDGLERRRRAAARRGIPPLRCHRPSFRSPARARSPPPRTSRSRCAGSSRCRPT